MTGALLAHPGTQYSFHLATELARHEQLSGFHTSLAVNAESKLTKCLSPLVRIITREKTWQNRLIHGVSPEKLHCYPELEFFSYWRIRWGQSPLRVLRERNNQFQQKIPDRALAAARAVIGFDTSSEILAARTNSLGKPFILDRSIAYAPSLNDNLEAIRERFPEWSEAGPTKSIADFEIEDREHNLARLIVVPSHFVAETLVASGVRRNKIRINPFGTNLDEFGIAAHYPPYDPFIFLFVGTLIARKGLPLLLRAWKNLQPTKAQLWIAGAGHIPATVRRNLPHSVRIVGPVARQNLPQLFQKAHVFVFPSFLEGLAQVQVEAAACGLPVIGTNASGAEEIVEEGKTGFIIESGNLDQLIESINLFIKQPSLAVAMGKEAVKRRKQLSWSAYGDRWKEILREFL